VGEGSIVGLVPIIVSLCTTSIVSDFGLIIIVQGLHCMNHCVNSWALSKGAWTCIPLLVLFCDFVWLIYRIKLE